MNSEMSYGRSEPARADIAPAGRSVRCGGRLSAIALGSQALFLVALASSCGSPPSPAAAKAPEEERLGRTCAEDIDEQAIDRINAENKARAISGLLAAKCEGRKPLDYAVVIQSDVVAVRSASWDWQPAEMSYGAQIHGLQDNTVYQVRMKNGEEVVALGREEGHSCHASYPEVDHELSLCADGRVALFKVRALFKWVTCTVPPQPPGGLCNPYSTYKMIRLPVKRIEDVFDAGETAFEYTGVKVTERR
jgi:hypothetical protein